MTVLFLLVPLAILLAALAVGGFLWATRRGQLDDLETPAHRMLYDDDADRGPARHSEREP